LDDENIEYNDVMEILNTWPVLPESIPAVEGSVYQVNGKTDTYFIFNYDPVEGAMGISLTGYTSTTIKKLEKYSNFRFIVGSRRLEPLRWFLLVPNYGFDHSKMKLEHKMFLYPKSSLIRNLLFITSENVDELLTTEFNKPSSVNKPLLVVGFMQWDKGQLEHEVMRGDLCVTRSADFLNNNEPVCDI